ncbi:FAD-binding oxidoreductase [Actinoallomurus purpureus]|uniref:FAD-binding and (Fe-S)-binding domain-containing protein n=1 Tax=Actinoallomurus purpureus TaxID=478114 RepID=UPI0020920957|nr:FAD-binding and (Fe-S)-binding domain-containing protein [Actinoallomurus purpureus]MCO6003697.1 FAD-binding oxidoreductase [Actinoallomurus purpureus]
MAALRDGVPGLEVDAGAGRRAQYAYDASNYRVPPLAVAFPADAAQVAAVVRICGSLGVPIVARGGGTSMAGNAVGPGLVLDLSRHMNRVLHVDPETRTAVVEPGVVLDELQRAAAPHGLFFGPDPSSHSRCTLGGMIGNDACGNHSVRYGRTVEHVEALEIVTADGVHAIAEAGGLRPADPSDAEAVRRVTGIDTAVGRLVDGNLAAIRTELGRIPRQVSGYQLHHLLPERGRHAARALVGTEGGCAIVVRATVRLQPRPVATTLLAIGYADVVDAAADVPAILRHRPTAVEGMDEAIVATMRHRRGPDAVTGLPEGKAWLYVELDGDDVGAAGRRAAALLAELRSTGRMTAGQVGDDLAERRSLWRVREDGAGLAARLVGGGESWPGWEDAAVAPEDLAGYLNDFRALLAEHSLTGVLYGHFGAGCVHVRIDFDMTTSAGIAVMRAFLRDAAALVVRHGGTLSGEHGDGRARSELLATMYGPRMLAAFAAYKRIFDPDGLLNPGVVVDPAAIDADLALHDVASARPAPSRTGFTFPDDPDGRAGAARRCIGVGRCRSDGSAMCPSYQVTRDERDSTRGRARVLQEMLRGGPDGTLTDGWRSADAHDALDLCLSCKACASDCPVGVDMATYKAEFLHHHYRRRLRPRSHYTLGWLPWWAAAAGFAAAPVNAVLTSPAGRLVARLGGVTPERSLPRFAPRRALREALRGPATGRPDGRPVTGARDDRPAALLMVDSFTRAFRPEVAGAAARVLADAGAPAAVRSGLCCGLTWVSTGQLGIARRVMARTVRALDEGPDADLPIVLPEPSCAAALRHDAPALLGTEAARRVAARIRTFAGALSELADADWRPPNVPRQVTLQPHCHERAVFGAATQSALLRRLGVETIDESAVCCGLAGNFGFEADHYDTSMAVAELSLAPKLRRADEAGAVLADGFSCRTQIDHLTGVAGPRARHLAELLDPNPPGGSS